MNKYKETWETWTYIMILMILFAIPLVKKNAALLEIGCEPGNITKYLLSKRAAFDMYAINIATNRRVLAKKTILIFIYPTGWPDIIN